MNNYHVLRYSLIHTSFLGEFYGITPPTANLELLSRFFAKNPDYRDRAFISVKVRVIFITQRPENTKSSAIGRPC